MKSAVSGLMVMRFSYLKTGLAPLASMVDSSSSVGNLNLHHTPSENLAESPTMCLICDRMNDRITFFDCLP